MGKVYVEGDKDVLFAAEIRDASRTTQVPEALIRATIMAESSWNPRAVRVEPGDASYGLMQMTGKTARDVLHYKGELGPTDKAQLSIYLAPMLPGLYNPRTNILLGAQLLAANLRSGGQVIERAVSAYNGGWRPQYGFGTRATTAGRVCLAKSPDGQCQQWHNYAAGEFGNQAYVDKVMKYFAGYGGKLDARGHAIATSEVVLPPKPEIDPVDFAGIQAGLPAELKNGLTDLNASMEQASGKASTLIYVGVVLVIIAALAVFVRGRM